MTVEQLAELHGLTPRCVVYRVTRGISLELPPQRGAPGKRRSVTPFPRGTMPTTVSVCGHRHHTACNRCPECGALTAKGLRS